MVVRPRQRSAALAKWVRELGSTDAAAVERAKEALIKAGDAALPHLLASLEADDESVRLRAISLLALSGHRRAAAPLASLLHDPSWRVRQRAAGALARFPSALSVPALARLLGRESHVGVRTIAVRSLVRLVLTGHDTALRPLLDRLADPEEHPRPRMAAMDVFPWLVEEETADAVRALLTRLARSPEPAVARKARRMLDAPWPARLEPWALDRLLEDLASRRLATWHRAVTLLARGGGAIVEPAVRAMLARPQDREYARRVTLVLQEMSPRQLSPVAGFLESVEEPIPLLALVEVAEAAGSRSLLSRLARLIERLAQGPERDGPGELDEVRQRAHLALARAGSRLAVADLVRILEDPRFAVRTELAEAAGAIGTPRELPSLLRAYKRSRGLSRLALREAVLELARRERLRRTDRRLSALPPAERRAAIEILGLPRRTRKRPLPRLPGAESRGTLLG
ncbi:MAG: HEAT repeat domain-containing protein [Acidobacteria bacterium]|nr:MAG: HEAT repeat domain-containing protein [Acidobacteriota bacterium]